MPGHVFGGAWTERKLSVIKRYLEVYSQALKGQPFQRIYVDAFAGTGDRTDKRHAAQPSFLIFQTSTTSRRDQRVSHLKSYRRFTATFLLNV